MLLPEPSRLTNVADVDGAALDYEQYFKLEMRGTEDGDQEFWLFGYGLVVVSSSHGCVNLCPRRIGA